MAFVTSYRDYTPCKGVALSRETKVERAGYRSTKKMVEEFMRAGIMLSEARRSMYYDTDQRDGNPRDTELEPLRTRGRDYDLADAFQDGLKVKRRLDQQATAAAAAKAEAAKSSTIVEQTNGQQKSVEPKQS